MFSCRRLSDNSIGPCPVNTDAGADLVIDGGYQECRGASIGKNKFYVENVLEELDDDREWFLKESTADEGPTLLYIPQSGASTAPGPTVPVAGALLRSVIDVRGASGLTLRGLTVTHTVPTYMAAYECPSGGDWSIYRGAALFVEDSTNVTLEGLVFDQVSGNAILFSDAVNASTVRKCLFDRVGDSAIAMLGSSELMLGLQSEGSGKFPSNNLIEGNLVDTVGVYGKQTSAYFKGKAKANVVRNNVFMNGPR